MSSNSCHPNVFRLYTPKCLFLSPAIYSPHHYTLSAPKTLHTSVYQSTRMLLFPCIRDLDLMIRRHLVVCQRLFSSHRLWFRIIFHKCYVFLCGDHTNFFETRISTEELM